MKPRKVFTAVMLSLVLTSIMYGSAQAQAQIKSELLSTRIDNLKLEAQNLHMLLLQLSEKTSIPVGFEVSPKDNLSLTKRFKVQIEHGMLSEVLEAIVLQDPVYTWRVEDGVINIFPQECCRDPLLKELLNTKLEKFSVKRGLGKLGFRLNLSDDHAVKALLARYQVIQDNQSFMSRDFTPLGRNYELEVANVSVVELLNRVIRESHTKYWIMQRYGEHRQYFVVNL